MRNTGAILKPYRNLRVLWMNATAVWSAVKSPGDSPLWIPLLTSAMSGLSELLQSPPNHPKRRLRRTQSKPYRKFISAPWILAVAFWTAVKSLRFTALDSVVDRWNTRTYWILQQWVRQRG